MNDMINVCDVGAKGDGLTDDTTAFIDAVVKGQTEGKHVYVPRGRYVISKTINLKNIVLSGPDGGAWPSDIESLPSILPVHTDSPAFNLSAGSSLRGIDISYPKPGKAVKEIKPRPAAIVVSGIGVFISNLRIRYAWDGIIADGKSNVGRLNIENVFMAGIQNIGVRMTGTWDVPHLSNIEVWNSGNNQFVLQNGTGFLLGRNDLMRMTDCFAYGMRYGFLFQDSIDDCKIKGGTWGVMNGCSSDFCINGIVIQGSHRLSISGGLFMNHKECLVIDSTKAKIRVSCCELKTNGAPAVYVKNTAHLLLNGCTIMRDMKAHKFPAVLLEGGDTVLTGNSIESTYTGIEIKPGVRNVLIQGNIIQAPENIQVVIDKNTESKVVSTNNITRSPKYLPSTEPATQE